MVNTEDFIKRLENILEYYGLNASAFADKIGVQRSSLSHLLSGRNKPSLDFVMKISEEFPEVDLYWILNGKGTLLKSNALRTEPEIKTQPERKIVPGENNIPENAPQPGRKPDEEIPAQAALPLPGSGFSGDDAIYKIVVLYKDGSFKDFDHKKT